jgi:hypothetical protein
MLALAALNLLGVVLFGAVYAAAGASLLTQTAFVAALVGVFVLVTVLWLRVERWQGAGLEPVRRVGRVTIGLLVALIGVPAAVLMPLFGLDRLLPAGAPESGLIAPVMVLLLVSLALVVLVNVTGAVVRVGADLAGRLRARQPPS